MTTYKKGIAMYYIADGSTGCPLLETSLTSRAQAMVPLSELLAAQSEAKMLKDEVQAKVKDLAWMEGQLSKAQGQVNEARVEAAQLRAEMSGMVQRTDLEAARAQIKALDEALKKEGQQHADALNALREQLRALEQEKRDLLSNTQVSPGRRGGLLLCCLCRLLLTDAAPPQKMVPSSSLLESRCGHGFQIRRW